MTESSATYPNYKPSGVSWIGHVPTHWEVRRIKADVSDVVDLTNHRKRNESYVALEHVESWTGRIIESESDPTFENQVKRFRPGDVLFGKLRPYLAKVTHAQRHGVCVGEFLVLRPHHATVDPSYLTRLIRSKPAIGAIDASTFGAKMPRADWQFIGSMLVPIPPLDEQSTIVRYLDRADELINRYISAKERLIALLDEQRQAVIHQAVTRGLNPDVPLKRSDDDWFIEAPRHWNIQRLKTICTMKSGDGITTESIEPEGPYPVYGGNGIRGYSRNYTHEGHFALIGRQGALCGNVHSASGKFWASEHAVVASLKAAHSLDWFVPLLETMNLNQYSIAAAQPGLSVERVMNLSVPVPPSEEQTKIAEIINQADTRIGSTVSQVQRQIDLMNEYRTRLIADAVTGLIDVRNATVQLPGQHL